MENFISERMLKKIALLKSEEKYSEALVLLFKLLAQNPENPKLLKETGNLCFLVGMFDKAASLYEKAILFTDDDVEIKFRLAKTYKQLSDFEKANELFAEITEKDKDNAEYIAEYINSLRLSGKFEKATDIYENNPIDTPEILSEVAFANVSLKNIQKAKELFLKAAEFENVGFDTLFKCAEFLRDYVSCEEALDFVKKHPEMKINHKTSAFIGEIYFNLNNIEEALKYFVKALKSDPKNSYYYYSIGTAYSVKGFFKEAEINYQNALKLSPNNLFYIYTLAYLYYGAGEFSKAKDKVNFILSINPDNENALLLKSMIALDENDLLKSNDAATRILELNKSEDRAMYIKAMISKKLGWYEKACEYLENALLFVPRSLDYMSEVVLCALECNNFEKAERFCKKLINVSPGYVFAYEKLSQISVKRGDFSGALEYSDKIFEYDPDNTAALFCKAKIYGSNKLLDEAFAFMKRVLEKSPDNVEYLSYAGDLALERKDFKAAFSFYKKVCDANPGDIHARCLCARSLFGCLKPEEALVYYSEANRLNPANPDIAAEYAYALAYVKNYKYAMEVLRHCLVCNTNVEQIKKINDAVSKITAASVAERERNFPEDDDII